MTHRANASHIGSCLSAADLIAVLYGGVLRHDPQHPDWDARDYFILSKGHATAILYAVLAECGYFPIEWLDTYGQDGTCLPGHVTHHGIPGVELSTGSLGHGLPVGCGLALAAQQDQPTRRIYVLLSDGELDEGSNWEAILFAGHHKLTNLVALVDYNKIQSFGTVQEVLDLHPLVEKWQAFGWFVSEIDGHDHQQISDALGATSDRPHVVIAHTVKGKGVSFMENQLVWHYKSPNGDQLAQALHELGID
jgi:transketolase